ncbi:hypothetical protein [Kibdelosporangium philippinense]|uniref:hypothetical protein n=1 Tax=Kibdelosporangium philippinense TaxID=211113 RepID=UPI00360751B3
MHRSWTNKTDQGSVSVAFVPGGEFSAAVNVKPIQVNGTEGQMIEFGVTTHAAITWRVSPNEMARVDIQLVPDAMAVAQRVAASIKPVEFEASLPVQFGWLPAGVKFDGGQSESTNGKDVYTSMGLSATNAPALAALTIAPRRLDEPGCRASRSPYSASQGHT